MCHNFQDNPEIIKQIEKKPKIIKQKKKEGAEAGCYCGNMYLATSLNCFVLSLEGNNFGSGGGSGGGCNDNDACCCIIAVGGVVIASAIIVGGFTEFISAIEDAWNGSPGKLLTMGLTGGATGALCATAIALGIVSGPIGLLVLGAVTATSLILLASAALYSVFSERYEITRSDEKKLRVHHSNVGDAKNLMPKIKNKIDKIGYTFIGTKAHKQKKELKKIAAKLKSHGIFFQSEGGGGSGDGTTDYTNNNGYAGSQGSF